jgi:uncharacterized protein (TIGR02284 family)
MTNNSNVASAIQELVKTCRDGEKGYREAADHAKSSDLKSRFLEISAERGNFADQLDVELSGFGEQTKDDEGHVVAALHRAWIDAKEALGAGDHAILAWLEQGDDYAKGKYEKALKESLPQNTMTLVRQQYQSILRDHDQMKAMRDSRTAA